MIAWGHLISWYKQTYDITDSAGKLCKELIELNIYFYRN